MDTREGGAPAARPRDSAEAIAETHPGSAFGDACVQSPRAALERDRLRIQAEIVGYPMPIPACDVYFNGLLEERARICEALASLDRQERKKRE
jgi:hypothetical protein